MLREPKRLRLSAVCVGSKVLQRTKIQHMQIKVHYKVKLFFVTLRKNVLNSFGPWFETTPTRKENPSFSCEKKLMKDLQKRQDQERYFARSSNDVHEMPIHRKS